jgi:undecaprenyl-diphosphatase
VLLASIGLMVDPARRSLYRRLLRTVVAVEVTNALAKFAIARRRPRIRGLPALMTTRSDRSCPSAHASSSFAAARVLASVAPFRGVYLVAAAMALSRPYLGVHYPSDVLAGALLGTVTAELVERAERPRRHGRRSCPEVMAAAIASEALAMLAHPR